MARRAAALRGGRSPAPPTGNGGKNTHPSNNGDGCAKKFLRAPLDSLAAWRAREREDADDVREHGQSAHHGAGEREFEEEEPIATKNVFSQCERAASVAESSRQPRGADEENVQHEATTLRGLDSESRGHDRGDACGKEGHARELLQAGREFFEFLKERKLGALDVRDCKKVDKFMALYIDHLLLKGHAVDAGEKIKAAWEATYVEYSKVGSLRLPRLARGLKGFRRLAPNQQGWPLSEEALMAIAGQLVFEGHRDDAVLAALQFSAYLRPGQGHRIRVGDLLAPASRRHSSLQGNRLAPGHEVWASEPSR